MCVNKFVLTNSKQNSIAPADASDSNHQINSTSQVHCVNALNYFHIILSIVVPFKITTIEWNEPSSETKIKYHGHGAPEFRNKKKNNKTNRHTDNDRVNEEIRE